MKRKGKRLNFLCKHSLLSKTTFSINAYGIILIPLQTSHKGLNISYALSQKVILYLIVGTSHRQLIWKILRGISKFHIQNILNTPNIQ